MVPSPRPLLGRLLVWFLALGLAADIASRFIPYDSFAFRAWEPMTRYRSRLSPGAFEAGKRYQSDRSYGDLAALGNMPKARSYRPEVFSTDAYGFRNPPSVVGPAVALTVGSSFTAGAGLSDDETLAARLAPLVGGFVFNAGGSRAVPYRVADLVSLVGVRRGGVVVCEYLERLGWTPSGSRARIIRRAETLAAPALQSRAVMSVVGWLDTSPLAILLGQARKTVEDDVALPNSFAQNVVKVELSNGESMLFLPQEVGRKPDPSQASVAVRWAGELTELLRPRDVRVIVLLVPTKYNVYRPLAKEPSSLPPTQDGYLAQLEQTLRAHGVVVVNLLPRFRREAAEGLSRGDHIYLKDDSHWSSQGVAIAAQELASVWTQVPTTQAGD